jgi:multiple sugar transport system substrate-binding protein
VVLKDNLKNFFIIILFFIFIFILILVFNIYKPKSNKQKIIQDYKELEKIIKKEFRNTKEQQNYFKNKKVKIIFWHNLYPHEQIIMNQIIQEFNKKFPNIEVLNIAKGSYGQIAHSVANSLPINKQPHLVVSYPDHILFYSKSNKVVPLNIFMDNDEDFKQNHKNNLFPSFLSRMSLSEDNLDSKKHFFFPFMKTTEVMYYNSDILKEMKTKTKMLQKEQKIKILFDDKIDDNGIIQSELNWEELKILCSEMKKQKFHVKDFVPLIAESEVNFFLIDNEQSEIHHPQSNKEISSFFENPNIKQKLIYFKENFVNNGLMTTSRINGESDLKDFFKEQKNCFFISSTRRINALYNDNFNVELTFFPRNRTFDQNTNLNANENKQNDKKNFLLQGSNINLFYSHDKDEILSSWLFLKHLTSKETYIKIIQGIMGIIFTRQDVKDHFLKEKQKNKDKIVEISEQIKNQDQKILLKDKLNKRKELLHLKFIDFILNLTYGNENSQNITSFFTTPSFEASSLFRNIFQDLCCYVLAIDKNKKSLDLIQEIDFLFEESKKRIIFS